jgi:hypothetical protein
LLFGIIGGTAIALLGVFFLVVSLRIPKRVDGDLEMIRGPQSEGWKAWNRFKIGSSGAMLGVGGIVLAVSAFFWR